MPAPLPQIAPCPFCACKSAFSCALLQGFAVWCGSVRCEVRGPQRMTERAAIAAWNRAPRRAK